jgi:hypothetical protein
MAEFKQTPKQRARTQDVSNLLNRDINKYILYSLLGMNNLATLPIQDRQIPDNPDMKALGQVLPQINNMGVYPPSSDARLSQNVDDRRGQFSPINLQGINRAFPNPLNYLMGR